MWTHGSFPVYLQYLAESRCSLNVCETKCYPWFQSPIIFFILALHHTPPFHFTILLQQKAPRAPLRSDIVDHKHYPGLPHLPPHIQGVFWGVGFAGEGQHSKLTRFNLAIFQNQSLPILLFWWGGYALSHPQNASIQTTGSLVVHSVFCGRQPNLNLV